jgi:GT2 family glycosyltransferase
MAALRRSRPGTDPRVSAVVITRNRKRDLARALAQLVEAGEARHLIVVDNASSDGTCAMVRERFPGVDLLPLQRNRGAAARNVGVRRAGTRYVAFSDDDSWWQPGALRRAADLLDANSELALVAARVLVGPAEALDDSCSLMARSPLASARLPGPAVLGFLACGAVVRRAAFEAVGGFRAGWGVGGEEQLLAVDLLAAGQRLAYVSEIIVHHHPAGHGGEGARRRARTLRNDVWFAWLRRPLPGALRETARIAAAARVDSDARRALLYSIAGTPWVICARRPVTRTIEREIRLLEHQRRPGTSRRRAPEGAA